MIQVDDYPTILLYKAGEKENPVITILRGFFFYIFSSFYIYHEASFLHSCVAQLKLSTKSSAKEMAVLINKELKSKDPSAKDEL